VADHEGALQRLMCGWFVALPSRRVDLHRLALTLALLLLGGRVLLVKQAPAQLLQGVGINAGAHLHLVDAEYMLLDAEHAG
jgi:hypothetical protein